MPSNKVSERRKPLADIISGLAIRQIVEHGANGYADAVLEIVNDPDLFSGPGALRDWLGTLPKWRVRYDAAITAHAARAEASALAPDHPELRRYEQELADREKQLGALRSKLASADSEQLLFHRLSSVIKDTTVALRPVALRPDPAGGGKDYRHPVDLCVALTDEHADEVIKAAGTWGLERYNFDVFCLRLERWARMVIEYATVHLPRHHVERVHIFKLGDAIHGDLHGNAHRNHFANTIHAALAVADAEAEAIASILEHVPYVSIVGVSGNHPRRTVRKDHVDPHDNFDFLVMSQLTARLQKYIDAGRLDIHAPRSWSAFVEVRGKVMALNHGDDVKGTWGIPWYGFAKKEARVQALLTRKNAKVDFFWYGHFHQDVAVTEAGSRGVHSAAFTTTDSWTAEALAGGGEPMQAMMVIDDRPGMRSRLLDVPIWLRDDETEQAFWRGQRTPAFGRKNVLTQLGAADALADGGTVPLIKARK